MIKTPARPVSREEARQRQLSWYFTGKACKRGHVATRNFNNHSCHACRRGEPSTTPVISAKDVHRQWLAAFRERRAERLRSKKMLDLLS